jgi:hypothetical protein
MESTAAVFALAIVSLHSKFLIFGPRINLVEEVSFRFCKHLRQNAAARLVSSDAAGEKTLKLMTASNRQRVWSVAPFGRPSGADHQM